MHPSLVHFAGIKEYFFGFTTSKAGKDLGEGPPDYQIQVIKWIAIDIQRGELLLIR